MAQGKKDGKASQKGQAGSSDKKATAAEESSAKKAEESSSKKTSEAVEAKEAASHDDHDHDHAGGDHGHDAAAAHGHHAPNRKEYMYVFLALFVLTVLEVAVAQVPGISRTLVGLALVSLAVTKAATVGLYYMHLKHETRVLKLTVAIPMATPAVYALVLISEGAWRLAR
jgi:caa(3)-type oxidase subunit IV